MELPRLVGLAQRQEYNVWTVENWMALIRPARNLYSYHLMSSSDLTDLLGTFQALKAASGGWSLHF